MPSDNFLEQLGLACLGLGVLHFLAIAGRLSWFFLVGGSAPDGPRMVMGLVAGMILGFVGFFMSLVGSRSKV